MVATKRCGRSAGISAHSFNTACRKSPKSCEGYPSYWLQASIRPRCSMGFQSGKLTIDVGDVEITMMMIKRYCMSQWSWRCRYMMTSSNGNIFRVTGLFCGEFNGDRWIPRTKASDAALWCFLWSAPDKRFSKQSRSWWFETPSRSLWRHFNDVH